MKNYVKRVILFWFCMVFYMLVQAQVRENRITGHVYDSQNLPLAGVNIKVKNTPYGTVSNEKGEFVLVNGSKVYQLNFRLLVCGVKLSLIKVRLSWK